jgi:hypothetical protein
LSAWRAAQAFWNKEVNYVRGTSVSGKASHCEKSMVGFPSFGIGFTALFLMKCATRAEWLNLHAMYPIGAFLALIFVAFTLGTRREDNQRRKLRMQAFKDFAREYPWEFTYNLL